LLACATANAQSPHEYIIAARRLGTIEFIDPGTLHTLSSLTVHVPPDSTGLDGVFLNPDGRTLYIEGPVGGNSQVKNGCCWLYAIDLETLQAKQVAGIWGTKSRRAFVRIGPGMLRPVSEPAESPGKDSQQQVVPLPESALMSECADPSVTGNFSAATHLFVYEIFGGKLDRRESCSHVPGGVWMLDPVTHDVLAHLAPDLYFWQLVPNHAGSELYGITMECNTNPPLTGLVRIDTQDSSVLQYRVLDSDYWWIAAGKLLLSPSGNVSLPR
jgi:hypothetical protein